jgi:hypothetical protein
MNYIEYLAANIRSRIPTAVAVPSKSDALFLAYAVLCLVKGTDTTLEDVHNSWVAWMSEREPDHPSLVPFDQLPSSTQKEDAPFLAAILSEAESRP